MTPLPDRLLRRAEEVGVALSTAHVNQLTRYFDLLRRWNPRINLTSLPLDALSPGQFDRLLVEPIAAAALVPESARVWFDLGSGGGSPAVPLKVLRPSLRLSMIEAKSRKCAFLREVVRTVPLNSADVHQTRIEELPDSLGNSVDLLTVRAVRLDEPLSGVCARLLTASGRLLLFGGSEPPTIGGQALSLVSSRDIRTTSSAWVHLFARANE